MTIATARAAAAATCLAMVVAGTGLTAAQTPPQPSQVAAHWVGSWGAAPALPNGPEVTNQTVRQVVRLSLGGPALRIRISNELGTQPLVIGAAHVARPGDAPGPSTPRRTVSSPSAADRRSRCRPARRPSATRCRWTRRRSTAWR